MHQRWIWWPELATKSIELRERALYSYIGQVAGMLGLDSGSVSCEVADWASVYIALAQRLSQWPDHDVALLWDQQHGWALAVEPRPAGGVRVIAHHGETLVPAPWSVLAFVTTEFAEPNLPDTDAPALTVADVDSLLAEYLDTNGEPSPL